MAQFTQSIDKKKAPRKRTINPKYLENATLYYLQRFETTEGNLRSVLERKVIRHQGMAGLTDEVKGWISDVIAKMVRLGYVDDDRYGKMQARSMRLSGKSERMIINKLVEKGLRRDQASDLLRIVDEDIQENSIEDVDPEFDAAMKIAKKKRVGPFGTPPDDPKQKQKDMAKLARAGFSFDIIQRVFEAQAE